MKKTLSVLFATLVLCATFYFADGFRTMSGTFTTLAQDGGAEKSSPPAMLTLAGGVLVMLGLIRRKRSA